MFTFVTSECKPLPKPPGCPKHLDQTFILSEMGNMEKNKKSEMFRTIKEEVKRVLFAVFYGQKRFSG